MPTRNSEAFPLDLNRSEQLTLQRNLLSLTLEMMEPVFLGKRKATWDDMITVTMIVFLAPSGDDTEQHLPRWLAFLKFLVKEMNLNIEPDGSDEEYNEERRRFVLLPRSCHRTTRD
jgi:hypothetical protein